MNIKEIIAKKKYGNKLSRDEIEFFVNGFTDGSIPDYQMAALLMAIYYMGMDDEEIAQLTDAMARSGDMLDLSSIPGIKVDKHSTGGVGDKISLIVIPIMAALGIPAAKMSGRGLGHTGGTIDKLEAIPGFRTDLSTEEFFDNVKKHNMAIVSQTGNLTPADKKIYALRDAIECVDSIPLIASSIMSKKIASGADAIVLDVKVGEGAFMKTKEDATKLATRMVEIGEQLGRKTVAVLTKMEQPLGREVGNANEVLEAAEVLKGGGESDETAVAVEIASQMAVLGGKFKTRDDAAEAVRDAIKSGRAYEEFKLLIELQHGDPAAVEDGSILSNYKEKKLIYGRDFCGLNDSGAERFYEEGIVSHINAQKIGEAAMLLGAGRMSKEDEIDSQAGIRCLAKVGEKVREGEPVFLLRSNGDFDAAIEVLRTAFTVIEDASGAERGPAAMRFDTNPIIGVINSGEI